MGSLPNMMDDFISGKMLSNQFVGVYCGPSFHDIVTPDIKLKLNHIQSAWLPESESPDPKLFYTASIYYS